MRQVESAVVGVFGIDRVNESLRASREPEGEQDGLESTSQQNASPEARKDQEAESADDAQGDGVRELEAVAAELDLTIENADKRDQGRL